MVAAARRQVARASEALLAGLPDKPEVGEIQACTGCGYEADSVVSGVRVVHNLPHSYPTHHKRHVRANG